MNTKTYWYRSKSLHTKDDVNYFPAGFLAVDDISDIEKHSYNDENNNVFFICYSKQQILDEVKKYGIFSPYIPMCVTIYKDDKFI